MIFFFFFFLNGASQTEVIYQILHSYTSILPLLTGSLLWLLLLGAFQKPSLVNSDFLELKKRFLPTFDKTLYSLNTKCIQQINEMCRYCSIVFCMYSMYVAIFTFCSSLPPTAFFPAFQGTVCSDCLYGCCCYPLSWLQISRELKRRAASHASSSSSSARYTLLDSLQGAHLV